MNNLNYKIILEQLFKRIRLDFQIGMREYLAALKAISGGWGNSEEDLKETLLFLWCHSPSQQEQFLAEWNAVKISLKKTEFNNKEKTKLKDQKPQEDRNQTQEDRNKSQIEKKIIPQETKSKECKSNHNFKTIPTRAPFITMNLESPIALKTDFPLTRRSMIYHWQYLNLPIKDGIKDIFNIDKTIEQSAQQGFFLYPIYTYRETNHAHLLLLIDNLGSMTPFHCLTRELVKTANYESTLQNLDIYYFHNVPTTSIYLDPYLIKPVLLTKVLEKCHRETSVLIISDGGAARGYRTLKRIQATTKFLLELREKTNYIAWLNPMPKNRWQKTSAQFIADRVSMYPINNQGMSNAIDTILGKKVSQYR